MVLDLAEGPKDLFAPTQANNPAPAAPPPPQYAPAPSVREDEVVARYDGPAEAPALPDPTLPDPAFRPRRNVGRLLTIASIIFAFVLIAAIGALVAIGPDTLSQRLGVAPAPMPLVIKITRKPDRRETASGNELLAVTGQIVNPTQTTQTVRDIRAELRDTQGRTVYSWTITRPVAQLGPGGTADFDSAAVDIPRGAKNLHLTFIGPAGS